MRFFDRLILLAKADAHGVLEQLEERSLLAKQCLREAELELERKRAQAETLQEELGRLEAEATRLEAEAARLDADVELALAGDEPDLARFGLRQWLPVKRALAANRERRGACEAERARLLAVLAEQEAQLEGLREQVRSKLDAERAGRLDPLDPPRTLLVAEEEVELELLRRRSRGGEPG